MSTDYHLFCGKCNEIVDISTDGMSGPMLNCDWSLAYFVVTHRHCELEILSEHEYDPEDEPFVNTKEWNKENKKDLLDYGRG